jgi:uncharacterized protein (TIGR03435 family)
MRRNDSPVTLSSKLLRIGIGVVALVVQIAARAEGQTFDVTSVKLNKSATDERSRMSFAPGGRFTATNVTLRELIRIAYGMPGNPLRDLQIVGGPDWLAGDRFDIEATAATATGPTDPNRQLRLRALLGDRFKLAVRNETRDLPIYALVLDRTDGRLGEQLRQSQLDCSQPGNFAPIPPATQGSACGINIGERSLIGRGVELSRVVQTMSNLASIGRPVADGTKLLGRFDFDLSWSAASAPQAGAGATDQSLDAVVTIFTAVREQLGLRLNSTSGPTVVWVVESVQRPSPD